MKRAHHSPLDKSLAEGIERKLGLPICTALVVGNMVGSGIFLFPATLSALGFYGLIAWSLASMIAMGLAIILARLSRRKPESGGPLAFTYRSFGPALGGVVAWSYWLSLVIGNATVASAFADYAVLLIPFEHPRLPIAISLAAIWLITAVNARSTYGAGRLQLVSTVLKILPLLLLVAVALPHVRVELLLQHPSTTPEISFFVTLASFFLWAFVGLESATVSVSVIRSPAHTIPIATLLGTLLVVVLYMLVVIASLGTVPLAELSSSSSPLVLLASQFMDDIGSLVITISGIISMFAALNGFILITGYLGQAGAERGFFPRFMANLSGPMHTPRPALYTAALISSFALSIAAFETLYDEFIITSALATSAMFIPYGLSCLAEACATWREKTAPVSAQIFISLLSFTLISVLVWGIAAGPSSSFFTAWLLAILVLGLISGIIVRKRSENDKRPPPKTTGEPEGKR